MALVPAICTQCGARIEVDDTHEAGICKHCGTAFITEKVIKNYYVTQNINVYNNKDDFEIAGGVLVKYNGSSTEVTIPNGVKKIGEKCFQNTYISSVIIPNSVIEIGASAFQNCVSLKEINIPSSVTIIGEFAFAGSKIKRITIPNSVRVIKRYAFLNCDNLEEINIEHGLTNIEEGAFSESNIKRIIIPDSVISIGGQAFCKCKELEEVIFSSNVLIIEYETFKECSNLKKVILPHYLKHIGSEAFVDCICLDNLVIPSKVEYIDSSAFFGCKNFKHVTIKARKTIQSGGSATFKKAPAASGSCYIATCVYGSYDCPQVWTLRRFRDNTLDATWYGRLFIKCYYAISPTLVKWFGEQKWFRTFWKNRLDKMVSKLNRQGVEETEYSDKF